MESKRHVRALFGQRKRNRFAQPASGAGDESSFSFEITHACIVMAEARLRDFPRIFGSSFSQVLALFFR